MRIRLNWHTQLPGTAAACLHTSGSIWDPRRGLARQTRQGRLETTRGWEGIAVGETRCSHAFVVDALERIDGNVPTAAGGQGRRASSGTAIKKSGPSSGDRSGSCRCAWPASGIARPAGTAVRAGEKQILLRVHCATSKRPVVQGLALGLDASSRRRFPRLWCGQATTTHISGNRGPRQLIKDARAAAFEESFGIARAVLCPSGQQKPVRR